MEAVRPPKIPSHRLTYEDATEVWIMRLQGHFSQRIAAHFDCNVGRVYEVLREELHPGSRLAAAERVESEDWMLAVKLRDFKFKPPAAANDDQLDLFSSKT